MTFQDTVRIHVCECGQPSHSIKAKYCLECAKRKSKEQKHQWKKRNKESIKRYNSLPDSVLRHRESNRKYLCKEEKLERSRQKSRKHLRRKYGIVGATGESGAGQTCQICGVDLVGGSKSNSAHLDHNHDTGKVRGWLCRSCNVGLGHFKDSPSLLVFAASYLISKED